MSISFNYFSRSLSFDKLWFFAKSKIFFLHLLESFYWSVSEPVNPFRSIFANSPQVRSIMHSFFTFNIYGIYWKHWFTPKILNLRNLESKNKTSTSNQNFDIFIFKGLLIQIPIFENPFLVCNMMKVFTRSTSASDFFWKNDKNLSGLKLESWNFVWTCFTIKFISPFMFLTSYYPLYVYFSFYSISVVATYLRFQATNLYIFGLVGKALACRTTLWLIIRFWIVTFVQVWLSDFEVLTICDGFFWTK
jgi:hypothetical protein